ncbi:peptidyl-prolyl cis-trans isomerase [Bifidobacterium lemurum]|uniref:Peptidyl-prolyl cis-trans isomerase n=1 Tax=Bifidobacterium lemurum TaxID=1603886 RepID=A0A261FVK9_9BIFI|nr:DUF4190 domain-containing protein [Bifidobacterium lemurum]OZG63192.1 peptidyl-prolyl cis-trans isomerase [Bifidobacterium lemurum]QOL33514.1 DUF4190 domain-containing protein [Bifidobacterium lemurum]
MSDTNTSPTPQPSNNPETDSFSASPAQPNPASDSTAAQQTAQPVYNYEQPTTAQSAPYTQPYAQPYAQQTAQQTAQAGEQSAPPAYGQYGAPEYGQYAQPNTGYGYPPQGVPGQQYPPQGAYYYGQPPTERWNALSIAGFVLSFLIAPVGLILSIVALVQINKTHEKSKGMSIAGIIIGALGTVLTIVLIALVVWLVGYSVDHWTTTA